MSQPRSHPNPIRRSVGIALCALPAMFALTSGLWPRSVPPMREGVGLVLIGIAGLIAALNLYLLYLRPWRYRRRQGTEEGYRLVSGLPIVGNLLVVGGCFVAFGSGRVGSWGLLVALADPDGLAWFPIRTWRDASLWDD